MSSQKSQVVAIKGPVCAELMSAQAVRRDLLTAGEKRTNLGCRCKWQKSAGDKRNRERGAETDGRASDGKCVARVVIAIVCRGDPAAS